MTRSSMPAQPHRSVTFRLPLPTYEALQQLAAADRRSLNGIVTILLEEAINNRQEKTHG